VVFADIGYLQLHLGDLLDFSFVSGLIFEDRNLAQPRTLVSKLLSRCLRQGLKVHNF